MSILVTQSLSWDIEWNAFLKSTKHVVVAGARVPCTSVLWDSWFGLLSPFLAGIPPVRLQFMFQSSLGSFPVWSKEGCCLHVRKSSCSVICTLFKITFLGISEMNVENIHSSGHSLTSFADRHIFCAFCSVLSLLLLWTVLLGPYQDLWLCDLLFDVWHKQPLNEVVEALAPCILVQFLSLLHHGTSLHNTLSTRLRFV